MASTTNIVVDHADNGLLVAEVSAATRISPSYVRLTLSGDSLRHWRHVGYDQWFRIAVPTSDSTRFDNLAPRFGMGGYLRYLSTPKATRPDIRSYTVRNWRHDQAELDVDFLAHGDTGRAGPWADSLPVGDPVGIIDQGCGFRAARGTDEVLLVGDGSALPAVAGILRDLPSHASGTAIIEVPHAEDRQEVTAPAGVELCWVTGTPGNGQGLPHWPRSRPSTRQIRTSTPSSPGSRNWPPAAVGISFRKGGLPRTGSLSAATGDTPEHRPRLRAQHLTPVGYPASRRLFRVCETSRYRAFEEEGTMPEFRYVDMLPIGEDKTPYRRLTTEGVEVVEGPEGRTFLKVAPEALTLLAETAMHDIAHYLRPAHLQQLRNILDDPEASANDKFVALDLLKNANIAAGGVLPMCQDTGTAIIMGKRGQQVISEGTDERPLSQGVFNAYTNLNLRYSQNAPITMWEEKNTGSNLPAQIELYADTAEGHENSYKFLFMAKGGGSANKTYLFQETKALLNPDSMMKFLEQKIRGLGTAACPPYHLAIVVGGTSAEFALKTAKYASAKYLDELPTEGSIAAHGFRDLELEEQVLELTRQLGIGAQFGGKYFCHDVRVIRLPRHGASLPVGIAVSCSADRQCKGKITPEGVFIEQLEFEPARFMPDTVATDLDEEADGVASTGKGAAVKIDLNQPMADVLAELTKLPVKTRVSLTGSLIVARDIAHAKIKERLDNGEEMPQYLKDHPVYYAGPAKTPTGMASGSFGPTTAGRMDSYVDQFQAAGGSMVMLAKGNRSQAVTDACNAHGGFYLGSIGGPAARLAQDCIKHVEQVEYPELGMEAIWKIEVEDFPAFVVVDDKGNDFFAEVNKPIALTIPKREGI